MELVYTLMDIPTEANEFLWKVKKIDDEAVIIGDYLMYLYIDVETRWVDVYTKEPVRVIEQFVDIENMIFDETKNTILYKDILFKIHHSENPQDEIYYRDITIREFMYDGSGLAIASSEDAIQDLDNEVLKIGIIKDPLKTFIDLFECRYQLGFDIGVKEEAKLYESFNSKNYKTDVILEEVKKMGSKEIQKVLIEWMELEKKNTIIHFELTEKNPEAFYLLKKKNFKIKRDVFDKIYHKNDFFEKEETYLFKERPFKEQIIEMQEKIKEEFKNKLLKLMYHYPLDVKYWKEEMDEPYFYHLILPKVIEKIKRENSKLGADLKGLSGMLATLDELINYSVKTDRKVDLTITNKIDYSEYEFDLEAYTQNKIVRIIEKTNGFPKSAIYNLETHEILDGQLSRNIHIKKSYEKAFKELFGVGVESGI